MYTYICTSLPSCVSLPPSLSHPSRWSQRTKLISLCYAAASHQPTILHSVVYIDRCYSHFPQLSPPPPCPQLHSLCLHLYSCHVTRFIITSFFVVVVRFHIYVLAYNICFSLSDLLHSV